MIIDYHFSIIIWGGFGGSAGNFSIITFLDGNSVVWPVKVITFLESDTGGCGGSSLIMIGSVGVGALCSYCLLTTGGAGTATLWSYNWLFN